MTQNKEVSETEKSVHEQHSKYVDVVEAGGSFFPTKT